MDPDREDSFEAAIRPNTKLIFIESLGNPNSNLIDIEEIAQIAHNHGIPLIIDNTFTTPYLLRPMNTGADSWCIPATKFNAGHALIGVIVTGESRLNASEISAADRAEIKYTRVTITERPSGGLYIKHGPHSRRTGAAFSPFHSFQFLQGLETLSLRVEHMSKTREVIDFLRNIRK